MEDLDGAVQLLIFFIYFFSFFSFSISLSLLFFSLFYSVAYTRRGSWKWRPWWFLLLLVSKRLVLVPRRLQHALRPSIYSALSGTESTHTSYSTASRHHARVGRHDHVRTRQESDFFLGFLRPQLSL